MVYLFFSVVQKFINESEWLWTWTDLQKLHPPLSPSSAALHGGGTGLNSTCRRQVIRRGSKSELSSTQYTVIKAPRHCESTFQAVSYAAGSRSNNNNGLFLHICIFSSPNFAFFLFRPKTIQFTETSSLITPNLSTAPF